MLRRLVPPIAFCAGLAITSGGAAQEAPLEPGSQTEPTVATPEAMLAPPSPAPLDERRSVLSHEHLGFEWLVSLGYGDTMELDRVDVEPYGLMPAVDVGYTWKRGLRLGGHVSYGFGRDIAQTYDPALGPDIELTSKTRSVSGTVSVGYDLGLRFLVLRYSMNLGVTWMSWDLGDHLRDSIGGYSPLKSSGYGFVWAPGLALLWPIERFEVGVGFDYLLQSHERIPDAIVWQLLLGMKL